MNHIDIERRLSIIKYLFLLGSDAISKGNRISRATCVLHYHDAIESFFVLAAEIVGVNKKNLNFMDYYEEIKIADKGKRNRELSYRIQMERLNKVRVSFKHLGIFPDEAVYGELKVAVTELLKECVPLFCQVRFESISLANCITNPVVKVIMINVEKDLQNKKYLECFANLGKAFYLLFDTDRLKTKDKFGRSVIFLQELSLQGSNPLENNIEDTINSRYNALIDPINILIAGIDYRRYAWFKCLTPSFYRTMDGNIHQREYRTDYKNRFNMNYKNAESAYFFVIECALKIEEFNFGLVSVWDKPEIVDVIDEDNVTYYHRKGKEEFEAKGILPRGTVLFNNNVLILTNPFEKSDFRQVYTGEMICWIKKDTKVRKEDHPDLKKE
jgi:hypothetical protein